MPAPWKDLGVCWSAGCLTHNNNFISALRYLEIKRPGLKAPAFDTAGQGLDYSATHTEPLWHCGLRHFKLRFPLQTGQVSVLPHRGLDELTLLGWPGIWPVSLQLSQGMDMVPPHIEHFSQ